MKRKEWMNSDTVGVVINSHSDTVGVVIPTQSEWSRRSKVVYNGGK